MPSPLLTHARYRLQEVVGMTTRQTVSLAAFLKIQNSRRGPAGVECCLSIISYKQTAHLQSSIIRTMSTMKLTAAIPAAMAILLSGILAAPTVSY
jgi:hypothetical protein